MASDTVSTETRSGMDRRRFLLAQTSLAAFVGLGGTALAAEASLEERVARLETAAGRVEDIRAVKRVKRAYSSYLEFGLWKDLIDIFADDAIGDYPAGVFKGRAMLYPHFIDNNGRGILGVENGRIMPHTSFQPVVTLSPDGKTAWARWKVFAMLGNMTGNGTASWNGALYEDRYTKQADGTWKIQDLRTHSEWGGGFDVGWTNVRPPVPGAAPPPGRFGRLPQPPVRAHNEACDGYAVSCVFAPSFGSGFVGRPIPAFLKTDDDAKQGELGARFAEAQRRIQRLSDEGEVIALNNAYGHHVDQKDWSKASALFADDGTLELGQQGVYVGPARIRKALELDGPQGLGAGEVFDHMDFGPLVTIGADGRIAKAHGTSLTFIGKDGKGEVQQGVYENTFVKSGGVWQIASIHYYPRMISDADKGWAKEAHQPRKASTSFPPDRPPTEVYEIYPKGYFAPLHYLNPGTGKPTQYPEGAPAATHEAEVIAFAARPAPARPASLAEVRAEIARAELEVKRAAAYDAIENLTSAYGYYTDESMAAELDAIFARGGSISLAGDASGPGRVGSFLKARYGETGTPGGTLVNHLVFQPVIRIAPDGRSASVHARLFEMTGKAQGQGGWAAGLYDDTMVNEDGTWKLKTVKLTRRWNAEFKASWAKAVVADNGGTGGSGRRRARSQ